MNTRHLKDIERSENKKQPHTFLMLQLDIRVEMTAFKKSEDGKSIIIRLVNKSDEDIKNITLNFDIEFKSAFLCNILEEKSVELEKVRSKIKIDFIKKLSFTTILITF